MQPGDYYELAIVVTALFVAPFNGLARVVVLAWIVGHVSFMLGLPERTANIAGQVCVLALGKAHLHGAADVQAWIFSAVLIVINIGCCIGFITPWITWWTVLLVAMAQLLVLSMAVNVATARAVMRAWRENGGRGMFRIGVRA